MFVLCFTAAIKLISQPVVVFNLQFENPCSEEAQTYQKLPQEAIVNILLTVYF